MGKGFYGGNDGRPFILKTTFKTVREMVNDFGKGNSLVNYGEYALINSENRNNPENGRLYRRTAFINSTVDCWEYDTQSKKFIKSSISDANGAKYIGTIVGSDGSAPKFELMGDRTLNQLKAIHGDSEFIKTESVLIPDSTSLVPGSSTDNNNKIQFTSYSFRDKNANSSTVYLTMQVPYNVIEWETEQLTSQEQVKIEELKRNAFYQKHKISIPKGQDGTSITNIRVITPTTSNKVVTFTFDNKSGIKRNADGSILTKAYTGLQDDINNARKIWVADVIDYKVTDNGDQYLLYLGDYNIIDSVKVEDDGTFIVEYSHKDDFVQDKLINWITGISLSNTGYLDIDTNTSRNEIHKQLHWVEDIKFLNDGTVSLKDIANGNRNKEYVNLIKWIKEVSLDEDGNFVVKFNHGADYSTSLKWLEKALIDENGVVSYYYSNQTTPEIQDTTLQWVKDIEVDDDGTTTFKYSNIDDKVKTELLTWIKSILIQQDGTVNVVSNNNKELLDENQAKLKWVNKVSLNEDGQFTYGFNNGEADVTQDKKLKWPINIQVKEDGKIETSYNDGSTEIQQSPQMDWIKSANIDTEKNLSIEYVNASPINVNLKTVNDIIFKDGGIYAVYNTGEEEVYKGASDGLYMNVIAGDENIDTSSLRAGGIWFVVQEG